MDIPKLRKVDDVAKEISKSLEILDNVLEEFEEKYSLKRGNRNNVIAATSARTPKVSMSLEMLDNILNEFKEEQEEREKAKRGFHTTTLRRHEDVRRSLEVLDNVLAEFDDCIDTWESPTLSRKDFDSSPNSARNIEETKWSEHYAIKSDQNHDHITFRKQLTDGSTSHVYDGVQDQSPASPPPVPKRNPATRLSEKIETHFTFPTDNTSLDSYDSFRLDSIEENGQVLSPEHLQQPIRTLSPERNDDSGVYHSLPDHCVGCGLSLSPHSKMDVSDSSNESSPFSLRKKVFEDKINENSSSKRSPLLQRPSFRLNKKTNHVQSRSETSLGPAFENIVNTMSVEFDPSNLEERMKQLHVKFKRVRELLRENKINLDIKPPMFIPPPPPVSRKIPNGFDASVPQEVSQNGVGSNCNANVGSVGINTLGDDDRSLNSNDSDHMTSTTDQNSVADSCTENSNSSNLCNRCSSSLSSGIDGILNPLPVEALVRPQFILSYSLEEDMSPGVKEILQTSKSEASSPSFVKTKESGVLSTFSTSANSLGYTSSQSELELNSLPEIPNKIPVSSFKSVTLPNGLDRSAFYSSSPPSNSNFLRRYNSNSPKDHNSNKVESSKKSSRHSSSDPLDWRNSSAPPDLEKPKKKESPFHFRGFSRKQKKDKK